MKEYIEREAAMREIESAMVSVLNDMPIRQFTKAIYEMAHRHCADVLARLPAADVVEEENILKFYYVRSIDEYWIGQRIDNFYYAEYDPKSRQWVWTHSRYLPWGEHIVSPTSLWKEHTYPSEPEEIPFAEWLQGFIKKHAADVVEFVRCKDCKFWECPTTPTHNKHFCDCWESGTYDVDFCSFGEKRDGGADK